MLEDIIQEIIYLIVKGILALIGFYFDLLVDYTFPTIIITAIVLHSFF